MRFTPDELAEIFFATQEAEWANYEATPDELKATGWIYKPSERLTLQQHKTRIEQGRRQNTYFSMDKVVTGARRNWKGR